MGSRDIQLGQAPSYNTNSHGNGNGNYRRPTRSYYGSSNSGTDTSKSMGAPLSSRFIVIERIKRSIQKDDLCGHIKYKNSNIGIRTLKLMSKSDSLYKRFLLEVSLEHILEKSHFSAAIVTRVLQENLIL